MVMKYCSRHITIGNKIKLGVAEYPYCSYSISAVILDSVMQLINIGLLVCLFVSCHLFHFCLFLCMFFLSLFQNFISQAKSCLMKPTPVLISNC